MRRRFVVPLLALVVVLSAACAGAGVTSSGPVAVPAPGVLTDASKGNIPTLQNTAPAQGIASLAVPDRDLIVTANVAMKSDDPWQTADAAKDIARRFGGSVIGLSESINNDRRSANLTLRIPADRFDDTVAALKKLEGEVIASSVDAKDVTDQLVDLDARLIALRAEEGRYLQLFASAKTVDEMLKVQMALSQLRQQIEQLAAQQKTTKDRVAYSTVTLSVASTAEPVPGPAAKWDPSRTFSTALAALASLLRFAADFAIWAMVFGGIPLLILGSLLVATRARRRVPVA